MVTCTLFMSGLIFMCVHVSVGVFSPLDTNEAPLPTANIVTPSDASRY